MTTWGVLPFDELLHWLAIQRVYAKSIGASYARPANDTRPEARCPGLVSGPARSASPPEAVAAEPRSSADTTERASGVFSAAAPVHLTPETFPLIAVWVARGAS